MDVVGSELPSATFKIICKNYPSEFNLDKDLAKEHFRQFGRVKRIALRAKLGTCVVEYVTKEGYLNALSNAGDYQGSVFDVSVQKPTESKRKREKAVKSSAPIYLEEDEIEAELKAMSGVASKMSSLPATASKRSLGDVPKVLKTRKSWKSKTSVAAQKKDKLKEREKLSSHISQERVGLIKLILSQCNSAAEKFEVLDARDKILRAKMKRNAVTKKGATAGTCPDMCPEKERLMRETKHQVALYEQGDSGKSMDYRKAVKQYSRSSANQETPLPHELRPVPVLQMTMCYLMHNLIDICDSPDVNLGEWYHFLWDRMRGIRKDIAQQELCCQGSVELVEQCARFHIHCSARLIAEEPSVFDQRINTENLTKCLQSLKYMYQDLELKGEHCPNEAEFRAYIILLNLNDGNFMREVQQLRKEIQKAAEVRFALDVYSALDKNNYAKFFKLVRTTTYLNACILMRYFVQVRVTALKILTKCYSTRVFKTMYPLSEIASVLGFDDLESATEFVQYYGLDLGESGAHIILQMRSFVLPELPYALERSLNLVESKRIHSAGRVICGKDLPPKNFENHVVQDSFEDKGYLMSKDFLDESDLEQVKIEIQTELDGVSDSVDGEAVVPQKGREKSKGASQPFISKGGIFAKQGFLTAAEPSNIFRTQPLKADTSIFSKPSTISQQPFAPTQDSGSFWTAEKPGTNIFAAAQAFPIKPTPTSFVKSNYVPNIFAPAGIAPKKGGFHFDLVEPAKTAKPTGFAPTSVIAKVPISPEVLVKQKTDPAVEGPPSKLHEKQQNEKASKELALLKRKQDQEQKKQEEKLRDLKRKRQEEELRRRMEELQKEEMLQDMRIEADVKDLLRTLVASVDDKIRDEKIEEIKRRIHRSKVSEVLRKWKETTSRNKRKRKAMDCGPVWVNPVSVKQCASELRSSSQDLTLAFMKRYKYGKPLDIEVLAESKIAKIELFQLTYSVLRNRFHELTGKLQKNVYWKVDVSLPDGDELENGASRIEETLDGAFNWDESGTNVVTEHIKLSASESVTYCVEKRLGLEVKGSSDANGIIFVAKDFNQTLQRRIFESLKGFGVFTKVPIVIVLQEYDRNDCKLQALIEAKIVSDYIILVENLSSPALVGLIEEALIFLASKVEKPPPLELDTLQSVVRKYLCTETWKRASSFAKWNSQYGTCLRDPNVVISLYNEGLAKLRKIVLNKSCQEYARFPDAFESHLVEIPGHLPCTYCWFPKFWKSQAYAHRLEKAMKGLSLPKWQEKWPPSSEFELEVAVSKYCGRAFKDSETPFYKVMSLLLRDVDPGVNFEDIANVFWTDVVEVLGLEKLNRAQLTLKGTEFEGKSIYDQYVVVYDVEAVRNYTLSDWFYIGNPMIEKRVKRLLKHKVPPPAPSSVVRLEEKSPLRFDEEVRSVCELTAKLLDRPRPESLQKELDDFNALLNDLETGIKIHRKISCTLEENLRRAIEDK